MTLPNFKSKTHLRKGQTDEWQKILSKSQIKKINDSMPKRWFKKFNWKNY